MLLIAGGVGINPLVSIVRETLHVDPTRRTSLLYSAKSDDEILFKVSFIFQIFYQWGMGAGDGRRGMGVGRNEPPCWAKIERSLLEKLENS